MPSTASQILRLELIGTGDQAGTWGNTTNTNLGTLLEGAIAGLASVSVTSANQALTATDYAADQARMAILTLTTTTTANFNVYAPPVSKTYVVYNNSAYDATIYNSTVLGNTTAAGIGVTIPAGRIVSVWSNGTNFYIAAVAGPASSTDNAVVRYDGTTGKVIQNSGVTIDDSNNVAGVAQLTTTGSVGVGTAVGAETLVVAGNSSVDIYKLRSNTVTPATTDAFIYRPADNTLGFGTASTEQVRIDSSGNVGVGTTSPSGASGRVLEVNGGAGQARLVLKNNTTGSASTDGSQIALVNSQLVIQNREASEIVFETNGAEQVRIDSVGNVGVGVNSPTQRLTIASTPSTPAAIVRTEASGIVTHFGSGASTAGLIGTFSADPFYFYTNSLQRAQITSAGFFEIDNGYGSIATFYGCRAWVNFDGTGTPTRRGNGNVGSITDLGTGDYRVNFTTSMPDTNYSVQANVNLSGNGQSANVANIISTATGNVQIQTWWSNFSSGGQFDPTIVCVSVFR